MPRDFARLGAPILVGLLVLAGPVLAQTAAPDAAFRDPALSAQARAADLVGRMTLEEKAGQLRHAAPAIPRLGVPAYNWWSEGLHGVARAGEATVFPQAIGLAATWDAALVGQVADVISTEFRAKYLQSVGPDGSSGQYRGLTVWSPNINIFRDPRWGRGQETYGEDPHLTAELGVAFVHGLQGDDLDHLKTLATAKHFAVHSGPEADRHREDVHPSAHDLEDSYLPAFRTLVTRGRVQAVTCAYNAVDGVPACANAPLLGRLKAWGFAGHVVSDCAAIADVYEPKAHGYVQTPAEAVAVSLKAGTDLICGEFGRDKSADIASIMTAVRDGLLGEADIDRAARRLFEARIRLGLFDPPGRRAFADITAADNDTPAHRHAALRAARASLVLLKNDGLLPLKAAPARIAVIGPNADSLDALVGNYNGTPSRPVTLLAGLRERFPTADIAYVEGVGLIGPPSERVPDTAFCRDAACARPGLKVEEFAGLDLAGAPTRTATDVNAAFAWGRPTRAARQTSIRWTGFLRPTESGPFRFVLGGEGGHRISVDGKRVVEAWAGPADPTAANAVDLVADRSYAITVEIRQDGSRGDQRLLWSRPARNDDAALAVAGKADLVVFVGGLTAKLEGEEMSVHAPGFAGGDRTSLDLPAPQQQLLERLHAFGKPVVLVLMNGSALGVNWADAHLPAIVEAWYPGGEGGRAVAGLLAGDFSPAGRLPVTFYRSADQLPPFKDYAMAGRTYRYFGGEALYPFGYGLSFTRFAYDQPVASRAMLAAGQPLTVSARVANTGDRDGDEVVQLYVSRPVSKPGAGAPIRALQGFQRIALRRGEARTVTFELDAGALSLVEADGRRVVGPGPVDLWIGGGQPLARPGLAQAPGAATRIEIAGRQVLDDPFAAAADDRRRR
jgi:beta-glucosidase